MRIYIVSKNDGPSWIDERKTILYIGTNTEEATKSVGEFVKYQKPKEEWPAKFPYIYSILPHNIPRMMVAFYEVDGWWVSIVQFEIH